MKILHTGDWHLGQRFYNYDRTDEERHFFGQLADAVRAERPDALLVCGDIFDAGTPGNDVAKAFTDSLLKVQAASPETEVVVIAGNHDSYSRLEVSRSLWALHKVHVLGTPAEDADGFADFDRNVIEIPGQGFVAAVPFCHPRNFPAVRGTAGIDRAAEYFAGLEAHVRARNTAGLPAVLMAHLAVGRDTDFTGQDRGGVIGGEECVEAGMLGTGYDYIALGHIHCPQWVKGGRKIARYCGTPRAIHFDETYPHGVDVVEVSAGAEPQLKTVAFKPKRELVTLGGATGKPFDEALGDLAGSSLAVETYVRLNVALGADELPAADWTERARQVAASKGLRYCLVNQIREAKDPLSPVGGGRRLTMEELKELSDDEVLKIMASAHTLSDRQKELLGGLMADIAAEANQ